MTDFDEIENQIRADAPLLPSHLRHRVLVHCAAERRHRQVKHRRSNWRLAIGFAVVFSLQVFVGGWLDAQNQRLIGNQNHALFAQAPSPEANNMTPGFSSWQMQAQLLASMELADWERRDYVAR